MRAAAARCRRLTASREAFTPPGRNYPSGRMGEAAGISSSAVVAAANLRVDAVTVEVVAALRDRGIEPILPKGPTLAHWLGSEAARPAIDAICSWSSGASRTPGGAHRSSASRDTWRAPMSTTSGPHPAWTWSRGGAHVDLHHSLAGSDARRTCWGRPPGPDRTAAPRAYGGRDPRPACRGLRAGAPCSPARRRRVGAGFVTSSSHWNGSSGRSGQGGRNRPTSRRSRRSLQGCRRCRRRRAGLRAGARRRSDGRGRSLGSIGAAASRFTLEQLARRPGIAAKAEFVRGRLLPPPSVDARTTRWHGAARRGSRPPMRGASCRRRHG